LFIIRKTKSGEGRKRGEKTMKKQEIHGYFLWKYVGEESKM